MKDVTAKHMKGVGAIKLNVAAHLLDVEGKLTDGGKNKDEYRDPPSTGNVFPPSLTLGRQNCSSGRSQNWSLLVLPLLLQPFIVSSACALNSFYINKTVEDASSPSTSSCWDAEVFGNEHGSAPTINMCRRSRCAIGDTRGLNLRFLTRLSSGRCVHVVAIGGSVTCGNDTPDKKTTAWPAQFIKWLNYFYPCNVEGNQQPRHSVTNLAIPSTGTGQWVEKLAHDAHFREHVAKADLLFVDTVINDVGMEQRLDKKGDAERQRMKSNRATLWSSVTKLDVVEPTDPSERHFSKLTEVLVLQLRHLFGGPLPLVYITPSFRYDSVFGAAATILNEDRSYVRLCPPPLLSLCSHITES